MKRTLVAGAALILGVNVIALTGVAYNRAGEPESALLLTERELFRPHQDWGFDHENSGLALKLQWRVRTDRTGKSEDYYPFVDYYADPVWLTPEKLAELGVDVPVPTDSERGKRRYRKFPAKEALLVLEFDGENYKAALDLARARAAAAAPAGTSDRDLISRAESAARQLEAEEKSTTRLFVVDAGKDERSLRAKYPDRTRYAIVHGRIQPTLSGEGKRARLRGHIAGLSIDQINVPLELRPVFEGIPADYGSATPARRFEALLTHGRRLEPWLASARKL